jgi:hypothetical protein
MRAILHHGGRGHVVTVELLFDLAQTRPSVALASFASAETRTKRREVSSSGRDTIYDQRVAGREALETFHLYGSLLRASSWHEPLTRNRRLTAVGEVRPWPWSPASNWVTVSRTRSRSAPMLTSTSSPAPSFEEVRPVAGWARLGGERTAIEPSDVHNRMCPISAGTDDQ